MMSEPRRSTPRINHWVRLAVVAVAALGAAEARQEAPLWERIQDLIAANDGERVGEVMSAEGSPEVVAQRYEFVVRSLYYPGNDLPAVIHVAQTGIDFALGEAAAAERRQDGEAAAQFRRAAKGLAYNLASSTWPGWDEPGINIRTQDLEAGFAAARLNFRLAEELAVGPEPMANAYFMLGAHALAAFDYDAASDYFSRFGEIARSADLRELTILAEGYRVITDAAAGSGNPGSYMLEPVRAQFRETLESGANFWIDQLDTAWRIFVTG